MFRLLRVIIRPSNELIQDYLIPSALWDPVSLTIIFLLALQPPLGVVFYSPLVGFNLLAYEVS